MIFPFRITLTLGVSSFLSWASEFSAFWSWIKPKMAMKPMMAIIRLPSRISPAKKEIRAPTIRIQIR